MERKVLVAVSDLFFAAKIRSAAQLLGIPIRFVKPGESLPEAARSFSPDLMIFDLNDDRYEPLAAIRQLRVNPALSGIRVVGYLSHVQVDLQRRSTEAGFDQVLPKSAFTQLLPNLLMGKE